MNSCRRRVLRLLFVFSSLVLGMPALGGPANPLGVRKLERAPVRTAAAMGFLEERPGLFVVNEGQWGEEGVRFGMRRRGANILITEEGPVIQLVKGDGDGSIRCAEVRVRFPGSNAVVAQGIRRGKATLNYYLGDRSRWRSGVPSYGGAIYRGLYDGIDLIAASKDEGVKLEFRAAPGADWREIVVAYEGIESLRLDEGGRLVMGTGVGEMVEEAPVIYQEVEGRREFVEGKFRLVGGKACGFEVTGGFDAGRTLVIDPDLSWSTYLGGSDEDISWGIATDGSGNVYVTGDTSSGDFPTTEGAYDRSHNGSADAFVSKFNAAGDLLWSTYLGGSEWDGSWQIATDGAGNAYILGDTSSSDFPTTEGAYDRTYNGGWADAFVLKLSAGGGLVWSTYLGGSDDDYGGGIATDGAGNVYVAGDTFSSDFPTTVGAYDRTYNDAWDGDDAYVSKFSTTGSLVWSTYLGGSDDEWAIGVATDGGGDAYITGDTFSTDFPTTPGAFDRSNEGGWDDAFVTKFSAAGALLWSTYLGGSESEWAVGIATDGTGNVYVTADTGSTDFPTTEGAYDRTYNGGWDDAFVSKFSGAGDLLWSTYVGGDGEEQGVGIATDGAGNVYVTGNTFSGDFPTTEGAYDRTYNGEGDGFVLKFSGGGELLWSTYFGGSEEDWGIGAATGGTGEVYVGGDTLSSGFPTTPGALGGSYNGARDAFVLKFHETTMEVAPQAPAVSTGEYLHFTTGVGGGAWWLTDSGSGASIDADNGVYEAGVTAGEDGVMYRLGGDSATTRVTVSDSPRAPGEVGPPTSMDVDGGGVGLADVIFMLKCVVGVETPTAEQMEAADFDLNGVVGLGDVINALRVVVGLAPVV